MMRKKVNYTNVTPIPSYIPRQLAIDLLHSHGEIINLNPLVLNYEAIKAPRDAPADEFYSTWYEIEERIQYIPGAGSMGSGKIKFKGCFHDMPWGIQTHTYAPMNIDLRYKWRIAGNQPGEPREPTEMGIGAPPDGLYLREDVEIKCNFTMLSFVKKEMKAASKKMVDRLVKKAELLDAGVLQAMMENGRLRTVNPADRTNRTNRTSTMSTFAEGGPLPPSPRPQSAYALPIKHNPYLLPTQPHPSTLPSRHSMHAPQQGNPYSPGNPYAHIQNQNQQPIIMELPGDYPGSQPENNFSRLQPSDNNNNRYSVMSELSADSPNPNTSDNGRWSTAASDYQHTSSSRPTSYATDTTGGMRSPRFDQNGFAPMRETREEHEGGQASALQSLEGRNHQVPSSPRLPNRPYNPADYVNA